MLAGVASGLADYLNTETAPVRLGFGVLTLVGGAGIVLYALAWILIPEAPDESGAARAPLFPRDLLTSLGVALVGLGSVALIRGLIPWIADRPVWPLAIIGLGLLLLLGKR